MAADPCARHEALWRDRETYPPVAYIHEGARWWRAAHGLSEPGDLTRRRAPCVEGVAIARAYESTPDASANPFVRLAYRQLAAETRAMFDFTVRELKIRVDYTDEPEPYATAVEQAEDLRLNHHITTESGLGGDHTLLTREEYDRFRTVHDVYGHAGVGTGFDRHGEYQAFLEHCSMYYGLARWAMASEYRGVNASLWAGNAVGAGRAVLLPPKLIFAE